MSWHAYRGLHSEKAKAQTFKLEVWLWWFALGLAAVLTVMVLVNISQL